jgi:hypothetical protein
MAQMHHAKVCEPLGQVAPGDVGTISVQHRIDKQPVVACCGTDVSGTSGQQIFDAFLLVVSECVSVSYRFVFVVAMRNRRLERYIW